MDKQPVKVPLSEQIGMNGKPTKRRYGWRDVLIQALALLEDEDGIPYSESALYKRRMKRVQE